jgi:hypothetical protein
MYKRGTKLSHPRATLPLCAKQLNLRAPEEIYAKVLVGKISFLASALTCLLIVHFRPSLPYVS